MDKLHLVAKFLYEHEKMSGEEFQQVMEQDTLTSEVPSAGGTPKTAPQA